MAGEPAGITLCGLLDTTEPGGRCPATEAAALTAASPYGCGAKPASVCVALVPCMLYGDEPWCTQGRSGDPGMGPTL